MSTRIRVARVIARLNVGGPARQVAALATHLDPEIFEQRLFVGRTANDEASFLDPAQLPISTVHISRMARRTWPPDDALAFMRLLRELRRFRPDIIHTHTAKAGALGRAAAVLLRVPVRVHTFHGHTLHGYFSGVTQKAVTETERVLARATDCLTAVGHEVKHELLAARVGRVDQFRVVPPGVEFPRRYPRHEARTQLGLSHGATVIAFVGRLTGVKRPDRLIAVAREVVAQRQDAVLLIAGGGSHLETAKREAARMLGDRAHFLGWCADVGVVYSAADVVLLTSDNEGMPVSLIEAAAVGRPSVTTDVGSAREVVLDGETGLVVEATVPALSQALLRLLDDRALRESMGMAARERADREFTAARLAQDYAAIYHEFLAAKGPPDLKRSSNRRQGCAPLKENCGE